MFRSRWVRLSLAGLALLLVVAWFAPQIVAQTGLRNRLARAALSDFQGSIHVGSASLGWLRPVVLRDVEVRDGEGRLLLSVPRLESQRKLISLAGGGSDLGAFRCERPSLAVTLRGGSSNLEQSLAGYLARSGESSSSSGATTLQLEVVEARLQLHDEDTGRSWSLDGVNVSLGLGQQLAVRLRGSVEGGTLEADLQGDSLTARIDSLPLEMVGPFLRRFDPALRLEGRLSANLEGQLNSGRASGRVTIQNLHASRQGLPDELRADRLEILGSAERQGEDLNVTRAEVEGLNVVVGPPTSPLWRESRLRLASQLQYQPARDRLAIADLHLESELVNLQGQGALEELSRRQVLSLGGHIGYELARLEPTVQSVLGPSARLAGRGVRPFQLALSLADPAGLRAEAGANWDRLELLGVAAGPAELRARLADGWVRLAPVECVVSEGRLSLTPALRLETSELHLAAGSRLERARISPALSAGALRYAVPVLAGVGEVEGQLSLALDGGRLPLSAPERGELAGKVTVHSARLGASPLVRELAVLLRGNPDVQLRRESQIRFRMDRGRIHHEGLELVFPELTVKTSGWVGLDGSLALVAEFPVPPKWLAGTLGQAVAGQTIRLPITGTLDQPRLDQHALREASAQLARQAAKGVIEKKTENLEKKVEDKLKGLFRKKP